MEEGEGSLIPQVTHGLLGLQEGSTGEQAAPSKPKYIPSAAAVGMALGAGVGTAIDFRRLWLLVRLLICVGCGCWYGY